MKRLLLSLLLVCSLCLLSSPAQAKPWYKHKAFWVGQGINAAAAAADALITAHAVYPGSPLAEQNIFYSDHPGPGQLAGVTFALFVADFAAAAAGWHFSNGLSKPWQVLGKIAIPAIPITEHVYGIANNLKFSHECIQSGLNCK